MNRRSFLQLLGLGTGAIVVPKTYAFFGNGVWSPRPWRPRSQVAQCFVGPGDSMKTVYVDTNLRTGSNDGTSWANAYQQMESCEYRFENGDTLIVRLPDTFWELK